MKQTLNMPRIIYVTSDTSILPSNYIKAISSEKLDKLVLTSGRWASRRKLTILPGKFKDFDDV